MKKTIFAIIVGLGIASSIGFISTQRTQAYTCSIPQASGRIFVQLDSNNSPTNSYLVTAAADPLTAGASTWQPAVDINIPAGTYKVIMESQDNHSEIPQEFVHQEYEVFNVVFRDGVNHPANVVAYGPFSQDIPDNTDTKITNTGEQVVLSRNVTNVYAQHAYPNNTDNPQSLLAVCMALDPVGTVQSPALSIEKTAANTLNGIYSESASANPGDVISFKLVITSTGTSVATNVLVGDVVPTGMTYVAGSTKVNGSPVSDGITTTGIDLGTMGPNISKEVTLLMTVGSNTSAGTIMNIASTLADNVTRIHNTANVIVAVINNTTNNSICTGIATTSLQGVPKTSFAPGETFLASVAMKNIGNTAWTASNGYILGSQNPQDNFNFGYKRVTLQPVASPAQHVASNTYTNSDPVANNGIAYFNFSPTAPITPGTYSFAWEMLREGTAWFGDTCTKAITVL